MTCLYAVAPQGRGARQRAPYLDPPDPRSLARLLQRSNQVCLLLRIRYQRRTVVGEGQ